MVVASVRRMKFVLGAVLATLLMGCGVHEPQAVVSRQVFPDPRVTVDGSAMVSTAQPSAGPCAAYAVPIDGSQAFEAEISAAAADALGARATRVSVVGKRIVARFTFEPRTLGSLNASPAVTLDAEISIAGSAPSPIQWTAAATRPISNLCDGLGPAVADAYRAALRGLVAQVRERVAGR